MTDEPCNCDQALDLDARLSQLRDTVEGCIAIARDLCSERYDPKVGEILVGLQRAISDSKSPRAPKLSYSELTAENARLKERIKGLEEDLRDEQRETNRAFREGREEGAAESRRNSDADWDDRR